MDRTCRLCYKNKCDDAFHMVDLDFGGTCSACTISQLKEDIQGYYNNKQQLKAENNRLKEGLIIIRDCAKDHPNNFEEYNDVIYLTANELIKDNNA